MDGLDIILQLLGAYYLIIAPYSKIEESFNTQATHDIIKFGLDLTSYDNTEHPCVVPRTFVGSIFLAALVKPYLYLMKLPLSQGELVARGVVGALNMTAITRFRHTLADAYGKRGNGELVGKWFMMLTLGQFHLMWYASRLLPNMFALPLVIESFTRVLSRRPRSAIALLAFTCIVFRLELAALGGPLAFSLLLTDQLSLKPIITWGFFGLATGALLSFAVDSFFWGRPVLPELEAFIFNVLDGKASNWGVEPWHTYFTRHLPNILSSQFISVTSLFGFDYAPLPLRALLLASLGYIALLSVLPHKELRFIIYVAPIFTALTAGLVVRAPKYRDFLKLGAFTAVVFAVFRSFIKAWVSALNYPGGNALRVFHECVKEDEAAGKWIHIDTLSFMTGAQRFGELWNATIYHHSEDDNPTLALWPKFAYYIGELSQKQLTELGGNWKPLETVPAFLGINGRLPLVYFSKVKKDPIGFVKEVKETGILNFLKLIWKELVKVDEKIGIWQRVD